MYFQRIEKKTENAFYSLLILRCGHKMQCTTSSSSSVFSLIFFLPQLNAKVNAHVEFNHFTLKTLCVCLCLCIDFMNLPNVCEHVCACICAILYVYVFVASNVRRRHFLKLPSTKRNCIDSTHFRQLFHLILTRIFD